MEHARLFFISSCLVLLGACGPVSSPLISTPVPPLPGSAVVATSTPQPGEGLTLLAALTQLRPQIVRWHLDAVLAAIPRVETFDGRSPHWRFLVYSPSSRQGVLFSLVAPPLEVSDNDRNLQLVTVALQKFPRLAEIKPTRLIDSDRAFFLATHHDLLPDTKGMLSLQFVLVPAPRYVFQNPETNDTLTIDPVTGFVTTR